MGKIALVTNGSLSGEEMDKIFTSYGLEAEHFESERELLPRAHRGEFELVVIESGNGSKEGFRAGWILKNHEETSEIPLLMVVDEDEDETVMEGLRAGADEVITKPFSTQEFRLRVRSQIEKYRHLQELHDKQREIERINLRLKEDLEAGRRAQLGFLPLEENIPLDGVHAESYFRPCETLAGDFFDFAVSPEEREIYGILSDVTGHGPRSALYAAQIKSYLHGAAERNAGLLDLAESLNSLLHKGEEEIFATAVLFRADLDGAELEFISCGHPDFFLSRGDGSAVESYASGTFPLGVFEKFEGEVTRLELEFPSRMLLYSDALIERQDENGELFGIESLRETADRLFGGELDLHGVFSAVHEFGGEEPFDDDVTMFYLTMGERGATP